MTFRPLLATLLAAAPSAALAFGDMDCVGTEICNDEGCTPSFLTYRVDSDWPNDSLTITEGGVPRPMTLDLPEAADGGFPGQLIFRGADEVGLWLTGTGAIVRMELFNGTPGRTHHAICDAREAA